MVALATKSGLVIWSYQTGDIIKCNPPTVSGFYVLAGSHDHHLYCWRADVTGHLQWSVDLKVSTSVSPVVFDSGRSVLVATLAGTVVAVSHKDGKELWRWQLSEDESSPIFATPLVINMKAIVCLVKSQIFCINLSTGQTIWGPLTTNGPSTGDLYCPPVAVKLLDKRLVLIVPTYNRSILCFDITDKGSLLWKAPVKGDVCAAPLLVGNAVIIVDTSGILYLFNVLTGKAFSGKNTAKCVKASDAASGSSSEAKTSRLEKFQLTQWSTKVFSSPIYYRNKLFIGARDSCLHCFHLNDSSLTSASGPH